MSAADLDFLTDNAWLASDHHFGEASGRPGRPSHNLMRRRWKDRVREDDVLLHLGDLVTHERGGIALRGLPGIKFLIRGNLDEPLDLWFAQAHFAPLGRGDRPFYWNAPNGDLVAFSHEPLDSRRYEFDVNVHGHVHGGEVWPSYGPGRRVDVSVDSTDFAPIRLRDALARAHEPDEPPEHEQR